MAQNGIDQTKSAGKPNRARSLLLTTVGNEDEVSRVVFGLELIGPTGASPLPDSSPIEVESKPAKVVACPSASKPARPWHVMHEDWATKVCSVTELPRRIAWPDGSVKSV